MSRVVRRLLALPLLGVLAVSACGDDPVRLPERTLRLVVDGERVATPRLAWADIDRGIVSYDLLGDLELTSELIAPLHHRAVPGTERVVVDFRIPGTDDRRPLGYRRGIGGSPVGQVLVSRTPDGWLTQSRLQRSGRLSAPSTAPPPALH